MRHRHPTDMTLAAVVDGTLDAASLEVARRHIEECGRCQLRIGQAGPPIEREPSETSTGVAVAMAVGEVREEDPSRGDIWRLAWDDLSLLAVVWQAGDGGDLTVLPVFEQSDADEWCVLFSPSETGGLGDFAVSVALEATVPWPVLDARVGRVATTESLSELRSEYGSGSPAGLVPRGNRVSSEFDERTEVLDEVRDMLEQLSDAAWAPTPVAPTAADASSVGVLFDVLPPEEALAISRGAPPTDSQATLIEEATGTPAATPPLSPEIVRLLESPTRKHKIRARARRSGRSEASERRELAHSLHLGVAARQAGDAGIDYGVILDEILDG